VRGALFHTDLRRSCLPNWRRSMFRTVLIEPDFLMVVLYDCPGAPSFGTPISAVSTASGMLDPVSEQVVGCFCNLEAVTNRERVAGGLRC
jgi:hypothetical protein